MAVVKFSVVISMTYVLPFFISVVTRTCRIDP